MLILVLHHHDVFQVLVAPDEVSYQVAFEIAGKGCGVCEEKSVNTDLL